MVVVPAAVHLNVVEHQQLDRPPMADLRAPSRSRGGEDLLLLLREGPQALRQRPPAAEAGQWPFQLARIIFYQAAGLSLTPVSEVASHTLLAEAHLRAPHRLALTAGDTCPQELKRAPHFSAEACRALRTSSQAACRL